MLKAVLAAPAASSEASGGNIEDVRLLPFKPYGLSDAFWDAVSAVGARAASRLR
jgi:hypothetical protein